MSEETSERPAWKGHCYNWCGLTSENAKTRRNAKICCGTTFLLTVIIIILLFTVIIPAIMQSVVDQSDITLESTEISNVQANSFTSTTVVQFSNVNGPSGVKIKLTSTNIEWNHGNFGTMVKLGHSNTLNVKNNVDTTMTADATVTNSAAFADFNTYLMHNEQGVWGLSGKADVTFLITAAVNINNKQLIFQGWNNFSVPPVVRQTNLTNGTTEILYSQALVSMTSLSNVLLSLNQNLYYRFEYEGEVLGVGHIPDYVMRPGTVDMMSYIEFSPTNATAQDALMKLLSRYARGIDTNVTLSHFYTIPDIAWLAPALSSISMETTLPAVNQTMTMVKGITIYNQLIPINLPFTLTLYNPQSITVTITSIVGNLTIGDTKIADVNQPNISPPIVIEPYSTVTSQQLQSESYINSASLKLILDGSGVGNINDMIGVKFGSFPTTFLYIQENVPLTVSPIV
eukprot:gene14414-15952_t